MQAFYSFIRKESNCPNFIAFYNSFGITELLPYFEAKIFSCYTIQEWKPHPDVFLWAAKTMGFKPSECVVIEDSPTGVLKPQ